ncbi:MAG: DUF5689 domain-containing protein, partial [Weeksellaceae bacterium]|nr:DUF5689 domain-containing protein [Weeksellaceae bacterium]
MKINNILKTTLMSAIVMTSFSSCVKEDDWSTPEILCTNKFDAATISMADFAALAPAPESGSYSGTTYKIPASGSAVIFDGYIVSSDENGNFFKTISFQDKKENPTIGMQMEVDKSSNYADFPVGAHIRIKANGLVLGWDRGTLKLGSVDNTYAIGRIPSVLLNRYLSGVCNGNNRLDVATLVPTVLPNLSKALDTKYLNTLVKVAGVQFNESLVTPTQKTFIDYIAGVGQDTDRSIVDKNNNSTILRSSGYSTFGATLLPKESGDLTFVVSKYNANWQMIIRGLNDINFKNPRFVPGVPENPSASAVKLFNGSDFENWNNFLGSLNSFGLKSYATQGVGLGYNGTNSLQIKGTPTGNDYVFTSFATGGLPATPKRITFYIKGKATGKSLSFNVYKASDNSKYYSFNLGTFTNGAILGSFDGQLNQYTGSIDTGGNWKLVELTLSDLPDINVAEGKTVFALKVGSSAVYDLQ